MTADTVGGVWHYTLALARGLLSRGWSVHVLAMGAPLSASQRRAAEAIAGLDLRVRPYKLEWMLDPWEDVEAAGAWMLGVAEEVQPEVVHLNNYAHGKLPWKCPVLMVAHSCVYSWYEGVHQSLPPEKWHPYRRSVASGLAAASAVTAPTEAMLRVLSRFYGNFEAAPPIHNGLDPRGFGTAPKHPLVLGAGRLWDEAKNLKSLDRIAAGLSWPVFLAGSAEHPDGGQAEFERVQTLGHLGEEDIKRWMAKAAIYALPARYEPFGLGALEAGMSGCALVLGDIPTLREVWGEAAIFVDPRSDESIRSGIRRLIQDESLREEMAKRARARASIYTLERMVSRYVQQYDQLLNEKTSRPVSRRREEGLQRVAPPRVQVPAA